MTAEPRISRSCPYCGIRFSIDGVDAHHSQVLFERVHGAFFGRGQPSRPGERTFTITAHRCPECAGQIIWLNHVQPGDAYGDSSISSVTLLYPTSTRVPVPDLTPPPIADDFRQAHSVLSLSPKASAALSRRCLQTLIREQERIRDRDLVSEIRALLALNKLPSYLAADLDAIRVVGNFAAHPQKATETGAILDVEPDEAEWTLSVLGELIDFYFERLPTSQRRNTELRNKLRRAGKL
jgi:hypothetical protein